MSTYTFPPIRRRPDGSIDTDHYIARARDERSAAARQMAANLTRPAPTQATPATGRRGLLAAFGRRIGSA